MPPMNAFQVDIEYQGFRRLMMLAVVLYRLRLTWLAYLIPLGRWRVPGRSWSLVFGLRDRIWL